MHYADPLSRWCFWCYNLTCGEWNRIKYCGIGIELRKNVLYFGVYVALQGFIVIFIECITAVLTKKNNITTLGKNSLSS